MNKELTKKSKLIGLILVFSPLIISVFGLLFTNGIIWIIFCLLVWLWFFFIYIFFVSEVIEKILFHLSHKIDIYILKKVGIGKKFRFSGKSIKRIRKIINVIISIFLAILLTIFLLTSYMGILTGWKAEQNRPEFEKIVNHLIDGKDTNESKAITILEWFDNKTGNIYNDWRLRNNLLFPPKGGMIKIYSTYPYITVRTYNDKDALWILTSQFGHCGEYSNLYRAMGDYAGLRVRKVCSDGENHCWNEVYINDTIKWKIVDPTTVFLDVEKNGYDGINLSWLKNKLGGNFTYVSAQEKGGKYINITRNYTTEVNITVLAVDNTQKPISGATIKLFSNNRDKKRDTNLKGVSDEDGEYTFTIGMGNYTFNATKDNLYGEITEIFSNDFLNYNRTIELI